MRGKVRFREYAKDNPNYAPPLTTEVTDATIEPSEEKVKDCTFGLIYSPCVLEFSFFSTSLHKLQYIVYCSRRKRWRKSVRDPLLLLLPWREFLVRRTMVPPLPCQLVLLLLLASMTTTPPPPLLHPLHLSLLGLPQKFKKGPFKQRLEIFSHLFSIVLVLQK